MAEVFGAAAGAVQLADIALRASREAYGFLCAIKNATEDVKNLRDALRVVEANVRSLRTFVNEFKKSKNALEEFEELSEAITGSFAGFYADIVALKQTLPAKPSAALGEKVKWAYNRRNVQDVTKRLKDRELSLNTALSITGRLHSLRIRQDTAALLEQGKVSNSTIIAQTNAIDSYTQTQQQNHNTVFQELQQANTGITATRNDSRQHHAELLQYSRQVGNSLTSLTAKSAQGHAITHAAINSARDNLEGFKTETHRQLDSAQQSLNDMTASLAEIRTTTVFSASGIDTMTQIFRNEIRSLLEPIVEQTFTRSESNNEAMLKKKETLIQTTASDIGQKTCESSSQDPEHGCVETFPIHRNGCNSRMSDRVRKEDEGKLAPDSHTLHETQLNHMISIFRRTWLFKWRIGVLRIDVCTTRERNSGSPIGDIYTEIHVLFRPSQTLMQLPGVAVLHSTRRDQGGFYKLANELHTVPIIPYDHPVIGAIDDHDLIQLQALLACGQGNIRMQTNDGWTLLHLAAITGNTQICKFLASQNLSWKEVDDEGITPMHLAIYGSFNYLPSYHKQSSNNLLTLIEDVGGHINQLWWDHKHVISHEFNADSRYWMTYLDVIEYITKHTHDGWYMVGNLMEHVYSPTQTNLHILQTCLRQGLSPNTAKLARYDEDFIGYPLLVHALWKASNARTQLSQQESDRQHQSEASSVDPRSVAGPDLWCIMTTLVQHGAHIYHIDSEEFDKASTWLDLRTIWNYAICYNITEEWFSALSESGVDVDEYCWEDTRRRKQALRLRGATRSGVDERVLELPSISGLRCRPCRRKYCWKHDRGIFDPSKGRKFSKN